MCGCGPSVDTYGATLNVHDFEQCYAIERLLVTPRVCRIYRRFTLLLLVPPQTTVFGATLNAKLRGGTLTHQWPKMLDFGAVLHFPDRFLSTFVSKSHKDARKYGHWSFTVSPRSLAFSVAPKTVVWGSTKSKSVKRR